MFGALVDYWAFTDDTTYNNETYQAMQHQMGDDDDYMPENQTLTEGNDDLLNLLSKLTRRRENEGLRALDLGVDLLENGN